MRNVKEITQTLKLGDDNSKEIIIKISVYISFTIIIFYVVFITYFKNYVGGEDNVERIRQILGNFSTPIAALLTLSYLYAYKYLDKSSFFFISIGWLINALYLPLELIFQNPCSKSNNLDCFSFRISVFAFSFLSSMMFFHAARINSQNNNRESTRYSDIFNKINGSIYYLLIPIVALNILLTYNSWDISEYLKPGGGTHDSSRFAISTLLGQIFSMYALIYLGYTFQNLVFPPNEKDLSKIGFTKYLPITFYLYGIIQITYPLHVYFLKYYREVDLFFFFSAMIFKLVNVTGLIILLRNKLTETYETQRINAELSREIAVKIAAEARVAGENALLKANVAEREAVEAKLQEKNAILQKEITEKKLKETENERANERLAREIEEKRRIEAELEKANTELQKELEKVTQLASLGAVVASIEHDIQIPVTNLEGKLKELTARSKEYGIYDKISGLLKRIETNKNRISASAQIIRFIRAEENFFKKKGFMTKLSVQKVLNDAIKEVKEALKLDTTKYFFLHNLEKRDFSIYAYEEMVFQILVNLFKNSYEALEEKNEKKGTITITVNQIKEFPEEIQKYIEEKYPKQIHFERWIRIDVSDEGCGIPTEIINQITEVFTTKEKANGGIGLFIAKKVLDIHNSIIYFSSEVNKRTIVSLFFPEYNVYKDFLEKEIRKTDKSSNKDETLVSNENLTGE